MGQGSKKEYAHPALVANRFSESSLSPSARTWPQSAKLVPLERILPSSSTSAIVIWTDAWSFETIRRSTNTKCFRQRHCPLFYTCRTQRREESERTGGGALPGDVKVNEDTLYTFEHYHQHAALSFTFASIKAGHGPDRSPCLSRVKRLQFRLPT